MTSRFWQAPQPTLPPEAGLGPVLAVSSLSTRSIKQLIGVTVGFLILDAAVLASGFENARVYGVMAVTPILVYSFATARRNVVAIGDGWIYQRTSAIGPGRWTRSHDLTEVSTRKITGGTVLVAKTTTGQKYRFKIEGRHLDTAAHADLARQLLDSSATISDPARRYLTSCLLDTP